MAALESGLARSPVVAMLGQRQCGKANLARQLVPAASANYFDFKPVCKLRTIIAHVHELAKGL